MLELGQIYYLQDRFEEFANLLIAHVNQHWKIFVSLQNSKVAFYDLFGIGGVLFYFILLLFWDSTSHKQQKIFLN